MIPDDPELSAEHLAEYGAAKLWDELQAKLTKLLVRYPHLSRRGTTPDVVAGVPPFARLANGESLDRTRLLDKAREAANRHKQTNHAPVKVKRTNIRVDDEFKQRVVDRLRRGEYLPDVARDENLNKSTLRGWAEKYGVKIALMPPEEAARRKQTADRLDLSPALVAARNQSDNVNPDERSLLIISILATANPLGRLSRKDLIELMEPAVATLSVNERKKADQRIGWHINNEVKAGRLNRPVSGTYALTRKGRDWREKKLAEG